MKMKVERFLCVFVFCLFFLLLLFFFCCFFFLLFFFAMIGLDSYSRQLSIDLFGPHFDIYQSLNRLRI